jgi:hypothetical protein
MKTIEIDGKSYLIDIEKATEQGLLKEKDSKPHSWKEHAIRRCETNNFFSSTGVNDDDGEDVICDYDIFNSMDEAKAFCALGKLIQLRDAWVGDWEPDWTNDKEYKWIIQYDYSDVHIYHSFVVSRPLSFPTKDMAIEFFDAFSGLLGQAKMFL